MDATVSPRPAYWPMTYSTRALKILATTKPPQCQGFGATNGVIVDDFVIEYVGDNLLHHLITVLTNYYTIMEDLNGKNLLAYTSSGITQKSMPNAHVAYPWRDILPTCSSIMDTKLPPNLNFPSTATAKSITAPKNSW